MPHRTGQARTVFCNSRDRARQILAGGTLETDHSEDELANNKLSWEWIYEPTNFQHDPYGSTALFDSTHGDDGESATKSNRRNARQTRNTPKYGEKRIVGARKGTCEFRIGDSVLLKADEASEPWAGVVSKFMVDEDGEKTAEFLWFSSERDIPPKKKKRLDFLPDERYITPFSDMNSLDSIDGKATILSEKTFKNAYPTGKIPRKSKAYGKTFICRRGCNTKTITYTDEFGWEDIPRKTEEDIRQLTRKLEMETRSAVKRASIKQARCDDAFADGFVPEDKVETPRKRLKTSEISTPRKSRTPSKPLTPSHRKVVVKKPLEFTPLGTRVLASERIFSSPFQTARSKLHVSSVPVTLPCREEEFSSVYSHLEAAITDGSGAIYISGTPGTGKTATVREVVAQLNESVMAEELDDFVFVEINGMKVTDPHQSYSLLWEALKGDRVSPSHALDLLEREFNNPSPRKVPCVVLMDELDQLVTKNQSVMYNFFNWPGLKHSKLVVLAVANTMDLPERTLSNKISSRLGLIRITFPGYTHEQLMRIIQSRLQGVLGDIVDSDAIQFASRKVAAVSGDARRALDICRRAVEIAESESAAAGIVPDTPRKSGDGARAPKSNGRVTIATIKRAINEATTSPLQQHLRDLPLSSKLLLAALIAKTRRSGIGESIMGEVLDEAKRMATMDTGGNIIGYILRGSISSSKGFQSHTRKPSKVPRVLSMGLAVVELIDAGIVGLETRKADRTGKIRLSISEEDVKLAFRDDPEIKNLGFS